MNDVLRQIVDATRSDLERDPINLVATESEARLVARERRSHRFREELSIAGTRIIAEIKSASPSAGSIARDPDVESIAREYADGGAAAVSVVTEPHFFNGSRGWLSRAAAASGLPVIMKDFIVDEAQIIRGVAARADAILLLASLLEAHRIRDFIAVCREYGCDALVEVHDEAELDRAIDGGAEIIGVNNRDLRSFEVSLETAERLGPIIPEGVIKVSESGIRTRDEIERLQSAGFSAFLIGESLMRSSERAGTILKLRGAGSEVSP